MSQRENGLITFESTSLALQGEAVFKQENIDFKTIPTPREVSHSCGLALLFDSDDIDKVKDVIEKGKINIDSLYKFIKYENRNKAEKIL
ncbi:MAG TPA: DUF3343 domain-containing protein [Tissierellaceae bacterium]|nr:DUF3343 domain-containing protein [Tissierellaceae bacterium]